jgi:hypothetical protein
MRLECWKNHLPGDLEKECCRVPLKATHRPHRWVAGEGVLFDDMPCRLFLPPVACVLHACPDTRSINQSSSDYYSVFICLQHDLLSLKRYEGHSKLSHREASHWQTHTYIRGTWVYIGIFEEKGKTCKTCNAATKRSHEQRWIDTICVASKPLSKLKGSSSRLSQPTTIIVKLICYQARVQMMKHFEFADLTHS